MKTLRQLSDDEQIEAIAADPTAEINLRIWAEDYLVARRRHDEFTRHLDRQDRIAKAVHYAAICVMLILAVIMIALSAFK